MSLFDLRGPAAPYLICVSSMNIEKKIEGTPDDVIFHILFDSDLRAYLHKRDIQIFYDFHGQERKERQPFVDYALDISNAEIQVFWNKLSTLTKKKFGDAFLAKQTVIQHSGQKRRPWIDEDPILSCRKQGTHMLMFLEKMDFLIPFFPNTPKEMLYDVASNAVVFCYKKIHQRQIKDELKSKIKMC